MKWIIVFVLYVGLTGLIISFMRQASRKDNMSRDINS
jgi:hypothetical protein